MIDALRRLYESIDEERRLSVDKAHLVEYLTTVRYFEKLFPRGAKILDACAGTGIYSFYLAS
ncbi:MAG: hypothetical protein PHI65_09755 [Firmicutes bacterium]|nr:hypothetical protein [Bacillota bacterium]